MTDFPKEYILFLQGLNKLGLANENEKLILEKEDGGKEGTAPPRMTPENKRGVKIND
jgi:hypothetical protein